jgi:hypothetical protein
MVECIRMPKAAKFTILLERLEISFYNIFYSTTNVNYWNIDIGFNFNRSGWRSNSAILFNKKIFTKKLAVQQKDSDRDLGNEYNTNNNIISNNKCDSIFSRIVHNNVQCWEKVLMIVYDIFSEYIYINYGYIIYLL